MGVLEDSTNQLIEQEVRKHEIVIVSAGYNVDQVTEAIVGLAKAFTIVIENIEEQTKKLFELFGQCNFAFEEIQEREIKREMYKLDFSRPVIRHQVIDRKPKRLIKKVIH